jgi:hypothetical protein
VYENALGMTNRDISEIRYDSLDVNGVNKGIDHARLGTLISGWSSNDGALTRPYLYIGFITLSKHITSIATMTGYGNPTYATWSYYLSYAEKGQVWTDYTENGAVKVLHSPVIHNECMHVMQ